MPYLRDGLARMGAVVETFETAATWDRIPALIDAVRSEVGGETVREPSRGRLPFSTEAKDALEASLGEAQSHRHGWIGSEHILLALVDAGGRPVEILTKLGAEPDAIRAEVSRLLEAAA
jgi:hypothetical protein